MIKREGLRRVIKLFVLICAALLGTLMPVKAYARNNKDSLIDKKAEQEDTDGPEIKVIITDAKKAYTNKERKAKVSVSDESFEKDFTREYIFKEGEDVLFLSVEDAAGNKSIYQSDIYIQDYTPPKAVVCGIKDADNLNKKIQIEIRFEEEWPDTDNSFVTISGQNNRKVNRYYFTENEKNLQINDDLEDDYYTLRVFLSDMAGNICEEELHFVLNQNGSMFKTDERSREATGKNVEEIKDFAVFENNLSPVYPGNERILFTHNGRVVTLKRDKDYYVEEKRDLKGYSYKYSLDNRLFEKEGVYTISLLTKDAAGNMNDTRLNRETDEIRFAVNKGEEHLILPMEDMGLKESQNATKQEKEKAYRFLSAAVICVLAAAVRELFGQNQKIIAKRSK